MEGGKKKKEMKCPVCEKSYTRNANMQRHMLSHSVLTPPLPRGHAAPTSLEYQKLAGRVREGTDASDKFACQTDTSHARPRSVVPSQENFECSVCSKGFIRKAYYERHKAKHVDENLFPFECDICLLAYRQEEDLLSHKKTHSNKMPTYKCENCPETFIHLSGLNRHMLSHGSNKPLKCSMCKIVFPDVISRSRHIMHHGIFCGVCKISFQNLLGFKNHIIDVHEPKMSVKIPVKKANEVSKTVVKNNQDKPVDENQMPCSVTAPMEVSSETKSYPNQCVQIADTALSSSENTSIQSSIERHWNMGNNFVNSSASFVSLNGNNSCVDTNFESWIDWLIEFLALCKSVKEPLKMDLVSKIVQIQDILIKVCQNPCGAIKNRKILSVLLRIKDELNQYHTLYCSYLGEKFLPPV